MNYLLEDCLKLNEEAIILMRDGKLLQSSLMLRKALENMELCFKYKKSKQQQSSGVFIVLSRQSSPETPTIEEVESEHCFDQDEDFEFQSVSIENGWTKQLQNLSSQNVFSFYPRMFHIHSGSEGQSSEVYLKKVLLILMFNEAICRHIMAALFVHEHRISPDRHMTRVLALYEAVIRAARASLSYEDAKEMLCVVVAATNNFGHISSHLMLFTETRDSIDYIIRLLEMSENDSFRTEDVHLFFQSICTFLEGRNLRNAPAA